MCPSPTFLLCVVLHGLPKIKPDGACCLFLRVYQSLQAVCTSAVYHVNAAQTDRLYFVVCYDKNSHSASRQVVFRLQFHTGLVHGHTLTFSKADLDCASEGRELWHNGHCVTVDYDTLDPLVRRDSYQDASPLETAPPHVLDPGVRKNIEQGASFHLSASSPGWSDRAPSASSDSGLSVASHGWAAAGLRRGAAREKGTQAGRLFPGVDFEIVQPLLENLPETQTSSHTEYSTHSWVRQQQMVDVVSDIHLQVDGGERLNRLRRERPPPLVVPGTPPRGFSSREAVQRGLEDEDGPHNVPLSTDVTHNIQSINTRQGLSCQEEDLSSLTTDIDESIEQLNQLILDLDPTFIPVPTSCAPCPDQPPSTPMASATREIPICQQQMKVSDVTDYAGLHSPGWKGGQSFRGSPANYSPPFSPSQHGHPYKTNSVDYRGQTDGSDIVPPTPGFPVSPPTPYGKR
ncbi:hypothetical protein F7725_028060 [Dissostichus mawsoni]|uniref:C2 tensin-type domain-containing protein n=1 Tax=Dissostichus mawsoni TaxID=36200 RepID=A0A7J5XEP8_DISMA|nr:hypothetical protein F7725_028060 [Dissostichus mawsoni]